MTNNAVIYFRGTTRISECEPGVKVQRCRVQRWNERPALSKSRLPLARETTTPAHWWERARPDALRLLLFLMTHTQSHPSTLLKLQCERDSLTRAGNSTLSLILQINHSSSVQTWIYSQTGVGGPDSRRLIINYLRVILGIYIKQRLLFAKCLQKSFSLMPQKTYNIDKDRLWKKAKIPKMSYIFYFSIRSVVFSNVYICICPFITKIYEIQYKGFGNWGSIHFTPSHVSLLKTWPNSTLVVLWLLRVIPKVKIKKYFKWVAIGKINF